MVLACKNFRVRGLSSELNRSYYECGLGFRMGQDVEGVDSKHLFMSRAFLQVQTLSGSSYYVESFPPDLLRIWESWFLPSTAQWALTEHGHIKANQQQENQQ